MRVKKLYLLWFIFTFVLGTIVFNLTRYFERRFGGPVAVISPVPTGSSIFDSRYESEIYRAIILADHADEKVIVLRAESGRDFSQADLEGRPLPLAFEPSEGVEEETLDDYCNKNQVESQLIPGDLGVNYVLVSEEEMSGLFENRGNGWASFRKKYPSANGLLTFSRVGFNKAHTQALVYVGWSCDFTCGNGGYVLLQKHGNKWSLKSVGGGWLS